jgi:hypothetical protein
MLGGMDIPAVAAAPWIALGVVAGILLVALAGLGVALARRGTRHPSVPEPAPSPDGHDDQDDGHDRDDLPGFLDFPPGSAAEPTRPAGGWPALSGSPPPPAAAPAPAGDRSGTGTAATLTAMAATGLLLIGGAAAVAAAARSPEPAASPAPEDDDPIPPPAAVPDPADPGALATASLPPDREGLSARLAFGGLVLERRAVGVTATYPVVRLSAAGEESLAHVELPTFNCLTDEAPEDPVAAGCSRSPTEYAELTAPDLTVQRDGPEVAIIGLFPTYLRPNGSAPVWTGRAYELSIRVAAGGRSAQGRGPAEGWLRLGADRAHTSAAAPSELDFGN